MNKEKDIQQLTEIINSYAFAEVRAERILEAGYGNVKQAIKKFGKRLKEKSTLHFLDGNNYILIKDIDNLIKEFCTNECLYL